MLRCTLLGIGAMASPRFRPAGLLVACRAWHVMLDGGPGAEPTSEIDAWLVCDRFSELQPAISRFAARRGLTADVATFRVRGFAIEPLPVEHTSHPTYGYLIRDGELRVAWAPEFATFPAWAGGVDLLFAEAAGWDRPIRFARGVGGHAPVLEVSRAARQAGVGRLVLAHVGRPTIRALDRGAIPPFGELGVEGRTYVVRKAGAPRPL